MIAITVVVLAIVGGSGGAFFFIGKRLQRAKQLAAPEEARERMVGVCDGSADDTSDRLRNGDFSCSGGGRFSGVCLFRLHGEGKRRAANRYAGYRRL